MSVRPIRVVLADDHPLMRAGIRSLLDQDPDIVCIGEASDGEEALRVTTDNVPDVLVLDMSMPLMNGITVTRCLQKTGIPSRVVALTVHEQPAWVRQLLEVGVGGYVLKRSATSDLLRAIHSVAAGRAWFDPGIAGQIVNQTVRHSLTTSIQIQNLTGREMDVLRLNILGYSIKEIAGQLNIGVRTVDTHKIRAMQKLGFTCKVDAVRYAKEKGWLDTP